jgi:2,3-bisphosphoglycerate-dependent phosphoglycerate mutase
MRSLLSRILFACLFVSISSVAFSQKDVPTTIIIVRHAEKDTGNNPRLTQAGMLRAEKLPGRFPGVKPDAIYASPYIRNQQTATPWAKEAGLEIQQFDPRNLPEFATLLRQSTGKTIVVVGHSNINPQLANQLLGEDRFNNLPDDDYETIYVVTIKKDKAKVKVMQ